MCCTEKNICIEMLFRSETEYRVLKENRAPFVVLYLLEYLPEKNIIKEKKTRFHVYFRKKIP